MAAYGVPLALIGQISQHAARKLRRVTLKDVLHHVHNMHHAGEAGAFVKVGQWLRDELEVRLAHQLMDFYRQPCMLMMCQPFAEVHDTHLATFEALSRFQRVKTGRDVVMLRDLLRREFQQQATTLPLLRTGVGQVHEHIGCYDPLQLQRFLDRFLGIKIGSRVLAENFVNLLDRVELGDFCVDSPGVVNECRLAPIMQDVGRAIDDLTTRIYGRSPAMVMEFGLDTEFLIIPSHLRFIFQEVLKNAVHATAEHHAHEKVLPPVHVSIRPGKYDVEVRVSDQGGGMRRRTLRRVWDFGFSEAPQRAGEAAGPAACGDRDTTCPLRSQLAGYGVGLPISRLYARYYGGDLVVHSVYGFGTDVSIRLNRLGDHVELGYGVDDDKDAG